MRNNRGVEVLGSAASAVAWAVLLPQPTLAQDTGQEAGTGLMEIVVTAQKREERLQDVPIAVSALSGDFIESRGITTIDKLSSLAPSLKIDRSASSSTTSNISIRGGVTVNPALFYEPSVGLYIDGVYIPKAHGSIFDLTDIQRIEVLRGPQGTLYGRNTLAGAINIVTRKPTGEFGGRVEASFGNFGEKGIRASVDLPRFGIVSAKVAGQFRKRDGFVDVVDNLVPDVTTPPRGTDELGSLDSRVGAVDVRIEPSETVTLDYRFDIAVNDQEPYASQLVGVAEGGMFDPSSPAYDTPFIGGATFPIDRFVEPRKRQRRLSADAPSREYMRNVGHALTATVDLGQVGELKSITAYRKLHVEDRLDLDGTALPLVAGARGSDYRSVSQELQLVGALDRLTYAVGLFYFDDRGVSRGNPSLFGGLSRNINRYGFDTESYAGYGQLDFELTDVLTVTGGLRYTRETKTIERFIQNLAPVPGVTLDAPRGSIPEVKFDNVSPTVVVRYEPTPFIDIYAKYARGYRSGGYNGEATQLSELVIPFDPEIVDSYELGLKSQWLDNRLQVNLTGYWNEHKDMQLAVFRGGASIETTIVNAGKARIRGLELEATMLPIDDLMVRATFGYIDPKYKEFFDRGVNVADNRAFPHLAESTASVSLDWTAWRSASRTLRLIADASYVSEYFTYPFALDPGPGENNAYNTESPGRTIVDARMVLSGLRLGDLDAELSIWGRNLLDEDDSSFFIDFGAGLGGMTAAYFPEPRTYGITLSVRF